MKVELNNIRLGISGLTKTAYVGTMGKNNKSWLNKKDVNNDFLHAVITRFNDKAEIIDNGESKYEITVKEIVL